MTTKITRLLFLLLFFLMAACVKETYNMDKLSTKAHLTPSLALAAIRGGVSLSDIVESGDTVIFDQYNFVKVIFREDSVIDLKLEDFYDLNDMVSFSQSYTVGELSIANFQNNIGFTLEQISQNFSPTLRSLFVLFDNGVHPFPAFPSVNLGERTFAAFPNFQNAVFASGFLDITIANNLAAPINPVNVSLFNTTGHTPIGNTLIIPAIQPGQTQTSTLNLTDRSVTNSIIAAVVLSGSPGSTSPVWISLANSGIQITLSGRDLKVKSGTVILPSQTISTLDNKDTISFDPGSGIELDELKVTSGNASYHIQSAAAIPATMNITLPTALRNGTPVSEVINIGSVASIDGNISFTNTVVDLGTDVEQPYNRLPLTYDIIVNSNNTMITFNSTDAIDFDLKLQNPTFDYVKGYFGQMTETVDPETIDLDITDILSHITNDFLLVSSPSIKLNYKNSFAIPFQFSLNATGKRGTKEVNLGLDPLTIVTPSAPAIRDVSATITIDKDNSDLPQLISLPPEIISFSGSAKMNPDGDPTNLRNNYVFGNSRFLGSLEIEVPMEFRFKNLQFADTVDNFMKDDSEESPLNIDNFGLLRVDLTASNGFPLGISIKMSLYDSVKDSIKATVDASDLLKPAPVDKDGMANGETESKTSIELTKDFFKSVNKADKIIFSFTLNTTDNETKDVKIYSNYSIDFNAALIVKPDINLK